MKKLNVSLAPSERLSRGRTMKKKDNKKKNRPQKRSDGDRALNRELGNFGLEPPKIYKSNQRNNSEKYDLDPEFSDLPSFSSQRRADNSRSQRSRSNARERIRPSDNANGRKRNERKISKIKRKIIFYGALSLSIIAIVVALSLTVLFKINTISIQGNEVYSQKEIIKGINEIYSD